MIDWKQFNELTFMTDQYKASSEGPLNLDNILESSGSAERSIVGIYLSAEADRLVVTHQSLVNGQPSKPAKHIIESMPNPKHNEASFAAFLGIPQSDAAWLTFYYLSKNPIYMIKIITTRGIGVVISDCVTGNEITGAGKDLEEAVSNFTRNKYPQGRGGTHSTR